MQETVLTQRHNNGHHSRSKTCMSSKGGDNNCRNLVRSMDSSGQNSTTAGSTVGFRKSAGIFLSRRALVYLSLFFVTAVLSTATLVYYCVVPNEQFATTDNNYDAAMFSADRPGVHLDGFDEHKAGRVSKKTSRIQSTARSKRTKSDGVRLPRAIKPVRYLLKLDPLINGNFSIFGSVEITIEVLEATSNITLHTSKIIVQNETVTLKPVDQIIGPGVPITEQTYDPTRDFYIASLGEELEVGQQYVLYMEYEGYLNDELSGFYRSQYTKADGTLTWLAATQFEPTDARKAFPCFDEPALKAEFEVYIKRQTHMTSISNMPLIETIPVDGDADSVWDHFNKSVPMSTYFVAFIVSDFTFLNSTYNDHVLFRVWTREGAISQAEYARKAGPFILTWYEKYFDVHFPLPKQDMIALPDFSAGAMENWGLITFREKLLLYDPQLSSASDKQSVAGVIAHELAHQWFGDLVTMEWWTDIWLNEGFATYMAYLGTNAFEPSWFIKDLFVTSDLQYVFSQDCLETSHPISIPVSHPEEINQLFDGISYYKGASIIRMMSHFLTETTFEAGITNYLNNHKYANAAQDDLWEALTKQAHADGNLPEDLTVKTIMDTWTLQMGYPVINVVNNGDGTATLTQKRFLMVHNPNSNDTHVYKWWVPITFTSQEDPDFSETHAPEWITNADDSITISGMPAVGNWVIFNVKQTGYYRVNYEPSNWQLIIDQLVDDFTVIHIINRAQIIDDALDLARAGQLSYDIALSVESYLGNETEYVPWNAALSNLGYLEMMFTRTGGYGALREYLLALLTPLYNSVGFEDNPDDLLLDQFTRNMARAWSCKFGLEDCVSNSVDLYAQWMKDPADLTIISPNEKSTVYCTAIAEGTEEHWDFAWNQFLTTNLASQKDTIMSALGCSTEVWILSRYLEMAFTESSGIRKQDSSKVFNTVANNDIGRDLAWDYLRNNVEMISSYFNTFTVIGGMVETVSDEFNTNEELASLKQFKEDNSDILSGATNSINQSIERTAINIDWMDNYYDLIVAWLQDNGYGTRLRHIASRKQQPR